MSKQIDGELVIDALKIAIANRSPEKGVLVHSDRGSQYTASSYQNLLAQHGMTCSMSGTANCYDNAAMESFFHSLKNEWTEHYKYETRAAARATIFYYIEVFYNRQRRHLYAERKAPLIYEVLAIAA